MFDGALPRRRKRRQKRRGRRNWRTIVSLFKEGAGLSEVFVKRQFPTSHRMPCLTALRSRDELTCFRSKLALPDG